jgi:hypothetical protein
LIQFDASEAASAACAALGIEAEILLRAAATCCRAPQKIGAESPTPTKLGKRTKNLFSRSSYLILVPQQFIVKKINN